jgi:hypothetical protein
MLSGPHALFVLILVMLIFSFLVLFCKLFFYMSLCKQAAGVVSAVYVPAIHVYFKDDLTVC